MKLIILSTFFLLTLVHASESFLLPDQTPDVLHKLSTLIRSAKKTIVLVTPELRSNILKKSLVKAVKRSMGITIITSAETIADAAYLAQFNKTGILTLRGLQTDTHEGQLRLSLIMIDNRRACIATLPFNEQAMRHDVAMASCTDDPEQLSRYHAYIATLLSRSAPYLQ